MGEIKQDYASGYIDKEGTERDSKKIDEVVLLLRKEMGKGDERDIGRERQLKDELWNLVKPAVIKKVAKIYGGYNQFLHKRDSVVDFDDMLSEAKIIILDHREWKLWGGDKKSQNGEAVKNFLNFFILSDHSGLESRLVSRFITRMHAKKRQGRKVSFEDEIPNTEGLKVSDKIADGNRDVLDMLIAKQEAERILSESGVLSRIKEIFSNPNVPILSLEVILRYGLGDVNAQYKLVDNMDDWVTKYGQMIKDYHDHGESETKSDIRKDRVANAVYDFLLAWENGSKNKKTIELINRIKHGAPLAIREIAMLVGLTHRAVGLSLDKNVGLSGRAHLYHKYELPKDLIEDGRGEGTQESEDLKKVA